MTNLIGKSTLTAPGWGRITKLKTSVQGDICQKEQEDHINVLELTAIFLGLKALCGSESNTHIQLYCDNTSSFAYLRNFGRNK